MKRLFLKGVFTLGLLLSSAVEAGIVGLNLIETGDDAIADINSVFNSSNVSVVANSEGFEGAQGIGDGAQTAIFDSVAITNGVNTLSLGEGFLITSGTADLANSNTDPSRSVDQGASGDTDLENLATANSLSSIVSNVSYFSFDFTLASGFNALTLDFIFGTEEFPTQNVTDILGIFVDGVNYAFFPDNSLVNNSSNSPNLTDNSVGVDTYDIEYNGLSQVLSVIGLIDENLTTHTLKIAIGDTSDTAYDSGLFVSNLNAITTSSGGGIVSAVSAPHHSILMLLGVGILYFRVKQPIALRPAQQ